VNISVSQDNELLAYEFQPSPEMLIGTDITLDSDDMGEKERDRLKKRKQVKKDQAEDSDQGTPTKHTRTKGKCKVETMPKESNEGSKVEAEGIQEEEEEEEAEVEGIVEEQEEEQETKALAKTPTKQATKTLLKGILKRGREETKPMVPKESDESSEVEAEGIQEEWETKALAKTPTKQATKTPLKGILKCGREETKPMAPKKSDESSEVEGSSDEEEQKTEVLAKHVRAAKHKGKGRTVRGRKVEEESAKDEEEEVEEEEEEEEKDISDIEEEKPAGRRSACTELLGPLQVSCLRPARTTS
jgi:hypothetical protein